MNYAATYLQSARDGLQELCELFESEGSKRCTCCDQPWPEPRPADAQRLDIKIWEALNFAKGTVWRRPDST